MDCVRTALRHRGEKVTCAYRRDGGQYAGSKEVKHAREEGAEFEFNVQPVTLGGWIATVGLTALRFAHTAG